MSLRVFSIAVLIQLITYTHEDRSLEARRTNLAQLPLEKLLHFKNSLGSKHNLKKGDIEETDLGEETALPFRTEDKRRKFPSRRGDPWEYEKESKGKDVSTIFQASVTVLSFLAFGGYLICLLCQALKNQSNVTSAVMLPVATTMTPAAIIGKKKRKKRSVEESMIRTLHLIAEGYAKWSTKEDK